jgi:hypothetical protein
MYFTDDVLNRIDRLANKAGISRSRLVSNLVDEGVKGLERADMVGILDFSLLMRDFSEGVKSWANQVRDEGHDIKRDWEEGRMAEA